MYGALIGQAHDGLEALKRHLVFSEHLRRSVSQYLISCKLNPSCFDFEFLTNAPDSVEWRIIDHCSAVTRVYSIYEDFAHGIIREHIRLLQDNYLFTDLPQRLQDSYRLGLSKVLEKKSGPRFGDIDLGVLVSQYNNALSGEPYSMESRALLIQEQNLRMSELNRLLAACGVEGVIDWVKQHESVRSFFDEQDRLSSSADSELDELIKYRNDAAHGGIVVDDLLGNHVLLELCDFTIALCEALAERVELEGVRNLSDLGRASKSGSVEMCIKSRRVVVGSMAGHFRIGDEVYLYGNGYCIRRRIESIQLDDVDKSEVLAEAPLVLGLGLDGEGRQGAHVFGPAMGDTAQSGDDAQSATADVG